MSRWLDCDAQLKLMRRVHAAYSMPTPTLVLHLVSRLDLVPPVLGCYVCLSCEKWRFDSLQIGPHDALIDRKSNPMNLAAAEEGTLGQGSTPGTRYL